MCVWFFSLSQARAAALEAEAARLRALLDGAHGELQETDAALADATERDRRARNALRANYERRRVADSAEPLFFADRTALHCIVSLLATALDAYFLLLGVLRNPP